MLQIQNRNQNWLPSIFDEFFFGDKLQSNFAAVPMTNIIENDKQFQIQVQASGFAKEEASISLSGDRIEISLLHKEENNKDNTPSKDSNGERYIRHEFISRNYKQSYVIPEDVDREKITASLENGILNVTLPKLELKQEENLVRQISIC